MADEALWALFFIELGTLSLVLALHLRLRKIAQAWVGKIVRTLNLKPGGTGLTLKERLLGGDPNETPTQSKRKSKADALVEQLAEQFGTDSDGLIEMAREYLGRGGGQGSEPGAPGETSEAAPGPRGPPRGPPVVGALLSKVLAGNLTKEDLEVGAPVALRWLQANWSREGSSGGGGGGPPGANW